MAARHSLLALLLGLVCVWSLPAIAQAVAPDPVSSAVVSAVGSAQGISWPVAVVLVAWIVSRELGRGVETCSRAIREWEPPSLRIRLDTRAEPWDGRERRDSPRDTRPPEA